MSNDRHQDERVSEVYRSLADEKTPQHLDREILQMASAQAKRPTYSRWMAWSRPLAWAATITLCLAITLELAREPSLEPSLEMPADIARELEAPESQYLAEPAGAADEGDLRKDEDAALEIEQSRDMPAALADSIVSEKTALGRSAARQPASEPAPAARRRQSTDEGVATAAELFEPEEEKAKLTAEAFRYEDQSAAMKTGANAAADMAIEEMVLVNDCPEVVQSDPETWLECILDLEEAGNQDGAERQRKALIDTFPDFKLP